MDDNKHDSNSTNAVTSAGTPTNLQKAGMISKDIKSALEKSLAAWDQLTQECSGPSAEEKRMEEMKSLLKDLKSKLDELSL